MNTKSRDTLDLKQEALNQQKRGGDIARAQVLATLALVTAVEDLVEEVRTLGAEAFPIHVRAS
jgi:hypothetical protein